MVLYCNNRNFHNYGNPLLNLRLQENRKLVERRRREKIKKYRYMYSFTIFNYAIIELTLEELHQYDSKSKPNVYIAIRNVIFDVT